MCPIMAVKINGRETFAPQVQEILTQYGCNIKTRVGFHEAAEDQCTMDGILVLQVCGVNEEIEAMFSALNKLDGVTAKFIEF